MKKILSVLFLSFGLYIQIQAQDFDVTKSVADPFTFIFNDGTNTVQGYIYATLEKSTKCCGNDAVYLEIKIDPSGSTIAAKALTGKNECYKKSIVDIVKHIKWNTSNIKTAKSVYLEVKPVLACANQPDDNKYVEVPAPKGGGQVVVNNNNTNANTNVNSNNNPTASSNDAQPANDGLAQPLPKPKYVSAGDRKPDESHIKSKLDAPGPSAVVPTYKQGETAMAIYFKSSLRKAGICGLAHVLAEISIAKDGTVKGYRIFNTNSDKVANVVGPIIMGLQYNALPMDQITYFEFKTDIDCTENAPKIDLTQIPNFLKIE
ncbi:MAG: hypothetical protein KatS3mg035_0198 [Bacteroidia bacterium]|nr:MAG: hypothetical protein KatS3mg035_0198 [Bacteroidia bacterium]